MTTRRTLFIPAEHSLSPEERSSAIQSPNSDWAAERYESTRDHYESLGMRMAVWWQRNGRGAPNERAYALWYAVYGSETRVAAPIAPDFLGPVLVESRVGQLPIDQLLSFLKSDAANAFHFDGNAPAPEDWAMLVRAWEAAAKSNP